MVRDTASIRPRRRIAGIEWVRVEVEVEGAEHVTHFVEGNKVLEYETLQIGGGNVSPLRSGGEEGRHAAKRRIHRDPGGERSGGVSENRGPQPLGLHEPEGEELQAVLHSPRRHRLQVNGS